MQRILIIDDDEMFRDFLKQRLTRQGYYVVDTDDGINAMRLLDQNDFDLTITDIIMPDKEGIETITDIKRLLPLMEIIAMSGGDRNNNVW